MKDTIIIGAGPAGMTAGIYTARKQLSTLILTKQIGGQMTWTDDIENYTGFSLVKGSDLTQKFRSHLESLKETLEIQEGVEVVDIKKLITGFEVLDNQGKKHQSKTVIIASGKDPRHLNIPGEQKFFGKGVAICATCDAPLYKNKIVAVVGGGNSAMEAILALAQTAKQVYNININQRLVGEDLVRTRVESLPNVTFLNQTKAIAIEGESFVTGLKIQDKNGTEKLLEVAGVFTEIGYETNAGFANLVNKNSKGEILVDANLQTSVPGIFSAGDINDAWGEQIIIAAGEGAKAALAVAKYLGR